jgi:hypothetical protein
VGFHLHHYLLSPHGLITLQSHSPSFSHGSSLLSQKSSTAPSEASYQTKLARPTLPVELIEQIFQHLYERLNPDPDRWWATARFSSRTFVKLSLVSKDWHTIAKKFRGAGFIGSEKGAKRFLSTFRKSNISIKKLHYDVNIADELLNKLLPLLHRGLTAVSIPVEMLNSKHAYTLFKNPATNHQIQSVHIYGKLADDYHTSWWKKAYIIHDIPTLTELSLTSLFIKGTPTEISAAVKSPIKSLSLVRIRFRSLASIEHLLRPIVYALEDIRILSLPSPELSRLLSYAGTSWVGLKRIEFPISDYAPHRSAMKVSDTSVLVIDVRKDVLNGEEFKQDEHNIHRLRALFQLYRKLNFETALSINFLDSALRICKSGPGEDLFLPLPKVFKLRKQLEDEEVKTFREAYALLTGSKERPTLVDPPEFFDSYFPDDPQAWEAEVSWF